MCESEISQETATVQMIIKHYISSGYRAKKQEVETGSITYELYQDKSLMQHRANTLQSRSSGVSKELRDE